MGDFSGLKTDGKTDIEIKRRRQEFRSDSTLSFPGMKEAEESRKMLREFFLSSE